MSAEDTAEGRVTMKVELTPALEAFVQESIVDGRYRDVSEVVSSGLQLLQDQDARKAAFMAMLKEAEEEAERDGYFTIEEVMAEMDAIIDAVETEKAKAAAE